MTDRTDRELLELAAKAAGHVFNAELMACTTIGVHGGWWKWNPLSDDGDALRLAVKLHLTVDIVPWGVDCAHYTKFTQGGGATDSYQSRGEDHAESTRRAIVRAAAAIAEGRD